MDDTNLIVYKDGRPIIKLNKAMLDKQNAWDNLDILKSLHLEIYSLRQQMMEKTIDLVEGDKKWTQLEFLLQRTWGFTENASYHKFWDRPGCTCPRMDNEDMYPSSTYFINGNCLLHGVKDEN